MENDFCRYLIAASVSVKKRQKTIDAIAITQIVATLLGGYCMMQLLKLEGEHKDPFQVFVAICCALVIVVGFAIRAKLEYDFTREEGVAYGMKKYFVPPWRYGINDDKLSEAKRIAAYGIEDYIQAFQYADDLLRSRSANYADVEAYNEMITWIGDFLPHVKLEWFEEPEIQQFLRCDMRTVRWFGVRIWKRYSFGRLNHDGMYYDNINNCFESIREQAVAFSKRKRNTAISFPQRKVKE